MSTSKSNNIFLITTIGYSFIQICVYNMMGIKKLLIDCTKHITYTVCIYVHIVTSLRQSTLKSIQVL